MNDFITTEYTIDSIRDSQYRQHEITGRVNGIFLKHLPGDAIDTYIKFRGKDPEGINQVKGALEIEYMARIINDEKGRRDAIRLAIAGFIQPTGELARAVQYVKKETQRDWEQFRREYKQDMRALNYSEEPLPPTPPIDFIDLWIESENIENLIKVEAAWYRVNDR